MKENRKRDKVLNGIEVQVLSLPHLACFRKKEICSDSYRTI